MPLEGRVYYIYWFCLIEAFLQWISLFFFSDHIPQKKHSGEASAQFVGSMVLGLIALTSFASGFIKLVSLTFINRAFSILVPLILYRESYMPKMEEFRCIRKAERWKLMAREEGFICFVW